MNSIPRERNSSSAFTSCLRLLAKRSYRRVYGVQLPKVTMAFLRREFGSKHPLIEQKIETDGRDLFIRSLGKLIAASSGDQLVMPELIEAYLKRIEWDERGIASRLYPFTRKRNFDEPKVVVIDPRISFGRPVLVGTGVRTSIVAERYKAGESVAELADDYGRARLDIEEAIAANWLSKLHNPPTFFLDRSLGRLKIAAARQRPTQTGFFLPLRNNLPRWNLRRANSRVIYAHCERRRFSRCEAIGRDSAPKCASKRKRLRSRIS
jgi:uncharacterized protein (DUF433 family)